jgi:hypothetical protein
MQCSALVSAAESMLGRFHALRWYPEGFHGYFRTPPPVESAVPLSEMDDAALVAQTQAGNLDAFTVLWGGMIGKF